jgi:tyrosine-protein kinase Etk/Wzc
MATRMDDNGTQTSRNTGDPAEADAVTLLDIFAFLLKRWLFIFTFTAAVSTAVLAFLLVTKFLPADSPWNLYPDYFVPKVSLLIQEADKGDSLSSALGGSGLGSISVLLGQTATGTSKSAKLAQSLLMEANGIADAMAGEFGFVERYGITKKPRTSTRKVFRESLVIMVSKDTPMVTIGYRHTDAVYATAIANRVVELLEAEFKLLSLEKVSLKKHYIEESIRNTEAEFETATRSMVTFQNRYGIFDLSQVSESVRQVASLQSQLVSKQLSLSLLRKSLPETDVRVAQAKLEIDGLEKLINELKEGSKDFSLGVVAARDVPDLSVEYLKLQRDVQIQQTLLGMLKQQYETAKLEELDTSQTLQVVERAEVPEVKSGPSRAITLILSGFVAFFIAILISFLMEYLSRAAHDATESAKLASIRAMLPHRRTRKPAAP